MAVDDPVRVLYMEDDPGVARLVQRRLQRAGYQVDIARDGGEGLAIYNPHIYDVLVVDHHMPVHDGLEIIRILSERGPLPPIIMITGMGSEQIAVEAMKLGASDYLVKDVDNGYLDLLPVIVERAQQRQQLIWQKQQAEQSLRENQSLLQAVIDHSPAVIYVKDTEGHYIIVNHRHAELLNRSREQILGRTDYDLFPARYAQGWYASDQQVLSTGLSAEVEEVVPLQDGFHTFLSLKFPIYNNQGIISAIAGVVTDITERKHAEELLRRSAAELEWHVQQRTIELTRTNQTLQAEVQERQRTQEALRKSEDRYRRLTENAPDMIYRLQLRPTFLVEYVSPAATTITGYTPQEYMHDPELGWRLVCAGIHTLSDVLSWNETTFDDTLVQSWFHKDGTRIWIEQRHVPVYDHAGLLVAIEGVARDITVRKQAEELLRMQYNLTLAVSAASTRAEAMQRLLEHVLQIGELDCGGVYLRDERSGSLYLVAHQGLSAGLDELVSQYATDTAQTRMILEGRPVYRSFADLVDACGVQHYDESLRAVAVIPVRNGERVVAALNLASRRCDEIPANVQSMLEAIAAQISGILARLEAQEALRESEERFRQVAEHIGAVVWLTDPDRNELLYVSPTCEIVYGLTQDELYANPRAFIEAIHPDDRAWVKAQIENQWIGVMEIEHRLLLADGVMRWVWVHTRPIMDEQGDLVRRVGIVKDITERKAYQQQIEHLAFSDRLTGLPNRNRLYQVGNATLAAMVPNGEGLALLYLDIDRFKAVNDTLGHDMGDELLVLVAERLRGCVPAGNLLARLGGDEFALLLPATSSAQAIEAAQHILEHLRQPFMLGEQLVHLWGSIGIAIGMGKDVSFSTLLTQADIAMYRAKARGGGVQIYDPALHPVRLDRLQMEADLRHALESDGLSLHYQPVLNLCADTVAWFEALVRWQHPVRGLLSPGMFLPLAEETGLIEEVDNWVLQTVIRQIAAWDAAGTTLAVSINLTAQSLQKPHLADSVAALLETEGVSPEQIIIELTEHTALRDLATTQQVLAELRQLGIRIALDDFGRGYASLTHLRQLPVDVLKLDAAFAAGIGKEVRDEAVIRALLTLAQGLGLVVVVEGIEEKAQRDWLCRDGCFLGQGYYIGRPVEPDSIKHLNRMQDMRQDDHVSSSA